MSKTHNTELSGAYFVRVSGKVVRGGVFEVDPQPEKGGWTESISPIPADKLPLFVGSFSPEIEADATILTSPKCPGVELILPRNTQLTAQQVREILRDVSAQFAPKTIAVKPNPTRS